ncbi:MAG: methyltransferase [Rhodobacteraceae bacterium]|nr:methyltransferase [Paracoccaceae bacterium]
MADLAPPLRRRRALPGWRRWRNRRAADPAFQAWASGCVLTRGIARRDGERLFDLVAGFVHSQILLALVELDLLRAALDRPVGTAALAGRAGVRPERMEALMRGAAALGLVERAGAGWQTARLGAALLGVPGLAGMIRHHRILYRDLADPVALLRSAGGGELARFWPYVLGPGAAEDPEAARRYSDLMAETQGLVAEEVLRLVDLSGVRRLMDVGGGTGAFLAAAGRAWPGLAMTLFDLPDVVAAAPPRLARAGVADRVALAAGSFRDGPLPAGADAVSLVRVLYDHGDETVALLLARVFEALPPGGRVIVAEPMSGGDRPERAGDAYFAFYCMAMGTGRVRSAAEIAAALAAAGFAGIRTRRGRRPFIASVVEAVRPP